MSQMSATLLTIYMDMIKFWRKCLKCLRIWPYRYENAKVHRKGKEGIERRDKTDNSC